jgi:hypothetical protein
MIKCFNTENCTAFGAYMGFVLLACLGFWILLFFEQKKAKKFFTKILTNNKTDL